MAVRLYCFDVDDTLVNFHLNGALERLGVPLLDNAPSEAVRYARQEDVEMQNAVAPYVYALVAELGFKNHEELLQLWRQVWESDGYVAITSFNAYPEAMKPLLAAMGLTAEEIASVFILTNYPQLDRNLAFSLGKNWHIAQAMEYFGVDDPAEVVLFDDRENNVTKALEAGHRAFKVEAAANPDPSYLQEALVWARELGEEWRSWVRGGRNATRGGDGASLQA